jgi:hypothetical protein
VSKWVPPVTISDIQGLVANSLSAMQHVIAHSLIRIFFRVLLNLKLSFLKALCATPWVASPVSTLIHKFSE